MGLSTLLIPCLDMTDVKEVATVAQFLALHVLCKAYCMHFLSIYDWFTRTNYYVAFYCSDLRRAQVQRMEKVNV